MNIASLGDWSAWAKSFPIKAAADTPYVSPFTVILAAGKAPEILIYGAIGRDWTSDDGIVAKEFAQILAGIPKNQRPKLRINSPGGNVCEGLAIYNLAKEHGVDCVVDGVAASIAADILCAGDTVEMPEASRVMIHKCYGIFIGNSDDVEDFKALLDTWDEAQFGIIAEKTHKTKEHIKKEMAKDRWFTGSEAVEFGIADKLISAATKGDKTKADATTTAAPHAIAPVTAAANLTTAPQGGAETTNKENKMREQLIALLNEWGVKFEASATDADLKALVAKGKPEAKKEETPEPKPAPAPANTIDVTAELAKIKAERAVERATTAIDKLIAEAKVTNDERDAEIALCASDPTRIQNVLAKRTPQLPGDTSAGHGMLITGSDLPLVALKKQLPLASARHAKLRTDWDDLWADAQIRDRRLGGILAANTYSSDLITDYLATGGITTLQHRLALLSCCALTFDTDPKKPKAQVQVSHVTGGTAAQTNATNFEANGDTTIAPLAITVNQITKIFHVSNADLQNGLEMAKLVDLNASLFANAIIQVINALITEANFTTNPAITSAFAAFGFSDLAQAWGLLQKSPIKNACLNGQYMARILNTPGMFQAAGTDSGTAWAKFGWDRIESNSNWTGAGANVNGIALNPQAIVVGVALPKSPPEGIPGNTLQQTSLPVRGLGISAQQNMWFSTASRTLWASYDSMFGAALGDETAGVLFKVA